jgi:hypothetical protein
MAKLALKALKISRWRTYQLLLRKNRLNYGCCWFGEKLRIIMIYNKNCKKMQAHGEKWCQMVKILLALRGLSKRKREL